MMNVECRMTRSDAGLCLDSAFYILYSAFLYLVYYMYSFDLQNLKCFLDKGFDTGVGHLL